MIVILRVQDSLWTQILNDFVESNFGLKLMQHQHHWCCI